MPEEKKKEEKAPKWAWGVLSIISSIIIIVSMIMIILKEKPMPIPSAAPAPIAPPDYPFCSNEADIWVEDKNPTVQVQLGGVGCWSAKVHLPSDHNVNLVVSEELHGIKFWGGKTLNRSDLVGYQQQTDGWFADITHKVFRLRGIGTATVRIEKIKT